MTNPKDRLDSVVLDDDMLALVGESLTPQIMPTERKNKLLATILSRVEDEESDVSTDFITVKAQQGEWVQLAPKIEKKCLFIDKVRQIESYLLRVQPGAEAPGHRHEQDEYCLVLEGDVRFDDLELNAGDFHFARRGSWHGTARSSGGALLYLEGAIA